METTKIKGSYFIFSDVTNYIRTKTFKFTLASVMEKSAKRITINNVELISTTEAQTFIAPILFRQMECTVTCHMFFNNELIYSN